MTPSIEATLESKAQHGDVGAMARLGVAYWGKQGIPTDYVKGKMWLERAADGGPIVAQMFLGSAYVSGNGLPKDNAQAAKYLLEAAQQPNVDASAQSSQALAQYFVARMYEEGDGLERSHEKAMQFLQMAAMGGCSPAQFDLGSLYNSGMGGVAKDKAVACQWFEKAADHGHPRAMFNTGYCYQLGAGGRKDSETAIHYYTLAAEAGLAPAQHNLGMLYGEAGNFEKAYFWLRIAGASGFDEAPAQQDPARLDVAKAHMTPAEVAQQEKDIAAWLEAHKAKAAATVTP